MQTGIDGMTYPTHSLGPILHQESIRAGGVWLDVPVSRAWQGGAMSATNQPDRARFEQELRGDILPFWIDHTVDRVNGGFYNAYQLSGRAEFSEASRRVRD